MTLEFAFLAALFACSVTILIVGTLTIMAWILQKLINIFMSVINGNIIIFDYLIHRKKYKEWKQLKNNNYGNKENNGK